MSIDIHNALGIRMMQLAEEQGKTVSMIAREGGLRQSTVSEILNGRSKHPKVSTIQAYCNGCGITLSEFFDSPLFRVETEETND